jgi:excisionase family DNA binding protein
MAKSTAKSPLTLAQAARYLHMGEKTLLMLATKDQIPGTKTGKSWAFAKAALDTWVAGQRAADDDVLDGMRMPLSDLLTDDSIIADLRASDALGVIEELAARAYSRGWLKNKPWFIGALVDRESLASTAMEGGVAFLHTRERDHGKITKPFIVVGRSYQGIDFGAPDGKPTFLFFLLGLTSDRMHLPTLGRLARVLKNAKVVSRLRATSSLTVMRSVLLKEDDHALKGRLAPVEFPNKPALNLEIRKRAIMRVAIKKREDEKQAKKATRTKKAAAKKAATTGSAATKKAATANKPATKKTATAKKAATKKTATKKTATAAKAPAKKAPAKKAPAKKAPARKRTTKKK